MESKKMKKIKQYQLLEKLGTGGMGEVYKGFDSVLERDVAIKVMHPHLMNDETSDARFMREARLLAKSVHPNIVTIHEIGKAELGRYIVMEFVEGVPLSNIVQQEKAIAPERCISMAQQILSGLQHAHNLGIVHRDVKSENILVMGMLRPRRFFFSRVSDFTSSLAFRWD